jgi:hypothetical protein
MYIIKSLINMVFDKEPDIRKKGFQLEDKFAGQFGKANIFAISDDFDDSAPRIVMESLHKHSSLIVSAVNAQLETRFDNEYNNNWDLCKNYTTERFMKIYDVFEDVISSKTRFIGAVTSILYNVESEPALDAILSRLSNDMVKRSNPLNASFKLTYIFEEKYFINISLSNHRDNSKPQSTEYTNCILAEIDVNDRYSANNDKNYRTSKEMISSVTEILSRIITIVIPDFINKGELII